MSKNIEKSKELFIKGYNCSQAVVGGFCDRVGLDLETALKVSSSFGGGMGKLGEVCGALTGAFMIIGMKYGTFDPSDASAKAEHYKLVKEISEKFRKKTGSILCRELVDENHNIITKVVERKSEGCYIDRPCLVFVEAAGEILEEYLR